MAGTFHPFGQFTPAFVDALAERLRGKSVLEVFAGNGTLAAELTRRGVDVVATTLFSGHDGHERGLRFPVVERDARAAVREFGRERDVLLMSWPTTTEAAAAAALEWGDERPIVFIGEVTRPELGLAGLGGCASDFFFEIAELQDEIAGYRGRGALDRAVVYRTNPESVARWRAGERAVAALRPGGAQAPGPA